MQNWCINHCIERFEALANFGRDVWFDGFKSPCHRWMISLCMSRPHTDILSLKRKLWQFLPLLSSMLVVCQIWREFKTSHKKKNCVAASPLRFGIWQTFHFFTKRKCRQTILRCEHLPPSLASALCLFYAISLLFDFLALEPIDIQSFSAFII